MSLAVPLGIPTVVMGATCRQDHTYAARSPASIPARSGVVGFDGEDITRLGAAPARVAAASLWCPRAGRCSAR